MGSALHRILVVDDDPQVHKLLGKMLHSPHFELLSAFCAEEAYTILEAQSPNMVIVDLMMPRVSGTEVCNFIRSNEKLRDTRVLMLSAKESQADRLDGLKHGADDYIAKPFHMHHLVRKIEHMLGVR